MVPMSLSPVRCGVKVLVVCAWALKGVCVDPWGGVESRNCV